MFLAAFFFFFFFPRISFFLMQLLMQLLTLVTAATVRPFWCSLFTNKSQAFTLPSLSTPRLSPLLSSRIPDKEITMPDAMDSGVDRLRDFRYDNNPDRLSPKDVKDATTNTAKWCAERCIKEGHCEALEDLHKMSAAQVKSFCQACILQEVNTPDECDISFMFIPDAPWGHVEPPTEAKELYKPYANPK